jgi:hypothetical protein
VYIHSLHTSLGEYLLHHPLETYFMLFLVQQILRQYWALGEIEKTRRRLSTKNLIKIDSRQIFSQRIAGSIT